MRCLITRLSCVLRPSVTRVMPFANSLIAQHFISLYILINFYLQYLKNKSGRLNIVSLPSTKLLVSCSQKSHILDPVKIISQKRTMSQLLNQLSKANIMTNSPCLSISLRIYNAVHEVFGVNYCSNLKT